MNYYILRLKSDNSRVDRIQARDLKDARETYILNISFYLLLINSGERTRRD